MNNKLNNVQETLLGYLTFGYVCIGGTLWYFIPQLWSHLHDYDSWVSFLYIAIALLLLPLSLATMGSLHIISFPCLLASFVSILITLSTALVLQCLYSSYLELILGTDTLDGVQFKYMELSLEFLAGVGWCGLIVWKLLEIWNGFYLEPAYPHGMVEYRFIQEDNFLNCSYFVENG